MAQSHGWGPIRSLLCLAPLLILVPWFSLRELYGNISNLFSVSVTLRPYSFSLQPFQSLLQSCDYAFLSTAVPAFVTDDSVFLSVNPETGLPQISETQILAYARHLSEDIGYRTVGTFEHALADKWMVNTAYEIQKECERLVREDPRRKLECEVWHQRGSGSHRCAPMVDSLEHSVTLVPINTIWRSQVRHDGEKVVQDLCRPHQYRHPRVRRHPRGQATRRAGERASRQHPAQSRRRGRRARRRRHARVSARAHAQPWMDAQLRHRLP